MPTFRYSGRDASGAQVSGDLEVASSELAASLLAGRGIIPLRIEAQPEAEAERAPWRLFGERGHLTLTELQIFSQQMHALLRAGLPILRSLGAIQESATRPPVAQLMGDIGASLDQGNELSAALRRHPDDFPSLYVAMVRVGEQTGRLDTVLKRLAEWLAFERDTRERVKAAVRYPTFVVIAMMAAMLVINLFVIPRFANVYQSMQVELPLITRVLIGFSGFMIAWWPLMLAAAAAAVFGFRRWRVSEAGGLAWDRLMLRVPVIGRILHNAALGRFARSMSMALRSGVPVPQSIHLIAQAVGNAFMSRRLERVRTGIERGESLHRACAAAGVFNPLVLQMISVGEESGTLDEMLEHMADFYAHDVDYDLKRLSSAIEPILIVLLGGMVLVLALGVFLPIWDLGQAAMRRGA